MLATLKSYYTNRLPEQPIIDRGHPLCPRHFFDLRGSDCRDLVRGSFGTRTGTGVINSIASPVGPLQNYPNPNSTVISDYFTTEVVDHSLTNLSVVAGIQVDDWSTNTSYQELVTRGSVFRNSTNYTFGIRTSSVTATNRRLYIYSRSAGGVLTGAESTQVSDDKPAGMYWIAGVSWLASTRLDFYADGVALGLGTGSAGAINTSADALRIGAGTSPTSSATGWQDRVSFVSIYDRALTPSEHMQLAMAPFCFVFAAFPRFIVNSVAAVGGNILIHPGMYGNMREMRGGLHG